MVKGGGAALAAVRRRAGRAVSKPVFGIAVLTPVVLAVSVGASAPSIKPVRDTTVTTLAAVGPVAPDDSGPSIVAAFKTPRPFHIAGGALSAIPPSVVINSPGSLRIPSIALNAYRNAERMMAAAAPSCGMSWNILAGIGRIESMHANGGSTDTNGTAVRPIYGPALDGTLPGNEVIVQSRSNDRITYARAMGPMQFLPGTWSRYAADGNGDGKADVQNVFDATLAAARYLCSGGLNMRDPNQVMTAILRYNNSVAYAQNVLGWARAYATGVVPVNLPPITGPIPPLGDAHLDTNPEGIGPGLPLNAIGLPAGDPLALTPIFDVGRTDVASQLPTAPGPGAVAPQQNCAVFCIGQNVPEPVPAPPAAPPPFFNPFAPPPEAVPAPVPAAPPAPVVPIAPPPVPNAAAPPPVFNPFAPPPPPAPAPAPVPAPPGPQPGPAA